MIWWKKYFLSSAWGNKVWIAALVVSFLWKILVSFIYKYKIGNKYKKEGL